MSLKPAKHVRINTFSSLRGKVGFVSRLFWGGKGVLSEKDMRREIK